MNADFRMLSASEAAIFDRQFAGRFFAVGSTTTKEATGNAGTMSQALNDLTQVESCGNGGVCIDILEVDANGKAL